MMTVAFSEDDLVVLEHEHARGLSPEAVFEMATLFSVKGLRAKARSSAFFEKNSS